MVQKIKVSGYDEFKKKIEETIKKNGNAQLNILFTGDKDNERRSWCPDCNEAEPHINKALEDYANKDSIFIEVQVGERAFWKDMKNPFRTDRDTNVSVIPTLIRWKTPIRLDGDDCAKTDLLEMFFKEENDDKYIIQKIEVVGYDEFRKKLNEILKNNKVQLNILFVGQKDKDGESWCRDSNIAEPFVYEALEKYGKKGSVFMTVQIGDQAFWKDEKNPFRTDSDLNLRSLPCLIRWNSPLRLDGLLCAKGDILEMFFKEVVEENKKRNQIIEVFGYAAFKAKIKELSTNNEKTQLNILFVGKRDEKGRSWCPDCNAADPIIYKALEDYGKKDAIFMEVQVGDSVFWKDKKNPFRIDHDTHLSSIPTLIRWNSPIRLDESLCAKKELVKMFFEEEDDDNVDQAIQRNSIIEKNATSGYYKFKTKIYNMIKNNIDTQLNLLFIGNKDINGQSWSSSCNNASPLIYSALHTIGKKGSMFVEVQVGERDIWQNMKNPFRTDVEIQLRILPTLMRWNTPIRLEGDLCAQNNLLEMFFTNRDDEEIELPCVCQRPTASKNQKPSEEKS